MQPDLIDRMVDEDKKFAEEVIDLVHKDIINKVEQGLSQQSVPEEQPKPSASSVEEATSQAEAVTFVTILPSEDGRYSVTVNGKTWYNKRRRDLVRRMRKLGLTAVS